ncbi:MAG TPA: hypothetical protein VGO18_10185, partial [Steroidobacteraceae bacterium]|nr:hypothetical protein [Steroidobacteraceae bacterium]
MSKVLSPNTTANRILARLSHEDFGLLEPHLEAVELPLRRSLEKRKRRIEYVYFPESGFASVVAVAPNKPSLELGLIGREGVTGLPVIMGVDRAAQDVFIQAPGWGWRMMVEPWRAADEKSSTLHRTVLRYAHSFMQQSAQTALANGRSKIDERLARWLLLAHDRLDGDEVPLTHE